MGSTEWIRNGSMIVRYSGTDPFYRVRAYPARPAYQLPNISPKQPSAGTSAER